MDNIGTVEQVGTPDVILDQSGVNASKKARAYTLTWNNYTEADYGTLEQLAKDSCSDWAFQREVGASGTPHIQGALYFKSPRSWAAVKKLLPSCHIEVARNWQAAKQYCMKSDTAVGKPNVKGKREVKDPLAGRELRPFQQEILDLLLTEPDDRTIHWYWEPNGAIGKTTLAKHICLQHKDAIYVAGKAADMKCAIAELVKNGNPPRICIVDLTRTVEGFTGSLYQGLEEIKNGIFFSGKYESGMVMYDCPHIICFANWEPDTEALSSDRWNVKKIPGVALAQGTPEPPSESPVG